MAAAEEGRVRPAGSVVPPRLGYTDRRVAPFLAVGASLQAVRATTVITLALFLQDTFSLPAEQAAQRTGIGFVSVAAAGLFAQLVLVQRLPPTARTMILSGCRSWSWPLDSSSWGGASGCTWRRSAASASAWFARAVPPARRSR